MKRRTIVTRGIEHNREWQRRRHWEAYQRRLRQLEKGRETQRKQREERRKKVTP